MHQHIRVFLSELGLSDKEITVYLAGLQYGQQTASVIAKKNAVGALYGEFYFW